MGHYAPITKVLIGRLIRQSLRWRESHRRNQQSEKSFHELVVAALAVGLPPEAPFTEDVQPTPITADQTEIKGRLSIANRKRTIQADCS